MNILILDDDPERHKKFASKLRGENVIGVSTALDCILYLKKYRWDVLFLDHDLGDDRPENTGYLVATWLATHSREYWPNQILIHSLNPSGAKSMHEILPGSQLVPFAWENIVRERA